EQARIASLARELAANEVSRLSTSGRFLYAASAALAASASAKSLGFNGRFVGGKNANSGSINEGSGLTSRDNARAAANCPSGLRGSVNALRRTSIAWGVCREISRRAASSRWAAVAIGSGSKADNCGTSMAGLLVAAVGGDCPKALCGVAALTAKTAISQNLPGAMSPSRRRETTFY